MEKYYVISMSVDGNGMRAYTKEELIKVLDEMRRDYEGEEMPYAFLDSKEADKECYDFNESPYKVNWDKTNWIIIKGEVVTPKPVEVITKYEI